MQRKPMTKEEALLKMATLCARSEQCLYDIRNKLISRGMGFEEVEEVIDELVERRFIDDCRFARSFARDKVRFSGWGRMKIRMGLKAKRIGDEDIRQALESIEESDYLDALSRAARVKSSSLDLKVREDQVKLYRHLLSRGFETGLAMAELKRQVRAAREG